MQGTSPHNPSPCEHLPAGAFCVCGFSYGWQYAILVTINRKSQGVTEMKNRIIGVIQWLYVETAQGGHIRYLHPGEAPRAVFELGDETPVAVYAYCNLHGLWMTKL